MKTQTALVLTSLLFVSFTTGSFAEARGKRYEKRKVQTTETTSESSVIHAQPHQPEVLSAYEEGSEPGENWKGQAERNRFEIGGLAGFGFLNGTGGLAIIPNAAVKVLPDGLLDDIADSGSIEFQGGPVFMSGGRHPFLFSTHLRWDFRMNSRWTFYGLGGVGGTVVGDGLGSNELDIYIRTGLGAMMDIGKIFSIRTEVSHELIALGVALPLF